MRCALFPVAVTRGARVLRDDAGGAFGHGDARADQGQHGDFTTQPTGIPGARIACGVIRKS